MLRSRKGNAGNIWFCSWSGIINSSIVGTCGDMWEFVGSTEPHKTVELLVKMEESNEFHQDAETVWGHSIDATWLSGR